MCVSLAGSPAHADLSDDFIFGSYGRVGISSDGEGAAGQKASIVPYGPRLAEDNYLELDLGYWAWRGENAKVKIMTGVAFGDALFHYNGQWDASMSLRQLYLEAEDIAKTGIYTWLGSRCYRGDDIYLLDFWPMDEQNTLGLGVGWRDSMTELTLHTGVNRLNNKYQFESISVPDNYYGSTSIDILDRQRSVTSLKAERRFGGNDGALGLKLRLYGEFHYLPSGTEPNGDALTNDATRDTRELPNDRGFLAGLQFGMWNFARNGHLNVWLRYATGLAAYDELAIPAAQNLDRRAVDAHEFRLAFSGNAEFPIADDLGFGIAYGGYFRNFEDGDGNEEDFDDRNEGVIAVRPELFVGLFTPAIEVSYQFSRANGLNPRSQNQDMASVWQFGLVPALTFSKDPGTYSRPQLRFIYSISKLNQAALDRYAADDPRSDKDIVHYIGARAEWWFGRGGGY